MLKRFIYYIKKINKNTRNAKGPTIRNILLVQAIVIKPNSDIHEKLLLAIIDISIYNWTT